MRAERRAGELLALMKQTGERDAGGRGKIESRRLPLLIRGTNQQYTQIASAVARDPILES
jgi:hypothetical protein